jgi:hypothetical protein
MDKRRFERTMVMLLMLLGAIALVPAGCPAWLSDVEGPFNDDADEPNDVDGPTVPAAPATVPTFDAARFSKPTQIDNPLFPLSPGTTLTYRGAGEEIVVEVLRGTREVAGVQCRIVRDRVYVDGRVVEDTFDWYAQDDDGNVWYMGEEVTDFNYDAAGNLLYVEHPGAWETLKDVAGIGVLALPGYIMPARPATGDRYHQEYYQGDAEDYAEIDSIDVEVVLADGSTYSAVKTHDLSTLDTSIDSFKYYAPGVGVILEESLDGERVELISVTHD